MTLPGQMELNTVIDHDYEIFRYPENVMELQDTHKPAGVRLAKMLNKYEYAPSSELWRKIQELSREILR